MGDVSAVDRLREAAVAGLNEGLRCGAAKGGMTLKVSPHNGLVQVSMTADDGAGTDFLLTADEAQWLRWRLFSVANGGV